MTDDRALLHTTYDGALMRGELVRDEGFKLKAYRDSRRIWSIGIGRNLEARRPTGTGGFAIGVTPGETAKLDITVASCLAHGINAHQALALCDNDIAGCEKDLDRALPWWRKLDPVRARALLNMCFNLGIGDAAHGLLSFSRSLAAMEAGRWPLAVANLKASRWDAQVGARADRIEAMFLTGTAPRVAAA